MLFVGLIPLLLFLFKPVGSHAKRRLVIGGELVPSLQEAREKYPFLALLSGSSRIDKVSGGCMGSLIAPDAVLTAAHCGDPRYVYLGMFNLDNPPWSEGAEVLEVERVYRHPSYSSDLANDIMVVKLNSSASSQFKPLSLDDVPCSSTAHIGSEATFAGYGSTDDACKKQTKDLKRGTAPIVSYQECEDTPHSTNQRAKWSKMVICAGRPGSPNGAEGATTVNKDDSELGCGDSGGPFFVRRGDEVYQIGVNSYGADTYFNGFARVANYIPWIQEVITGNTPALPPNCKDDPSFVDARGYGCADWGGYECTETEARDEEYPDPAANIASIIQACPTTCEAPGCKSSTATQPACSPTASPTEPETKFPTFPTQEPTAPPTDADEGSDSPTANPTEGTRPESMSSSPTQAPSPTSSKEGGSAEGVVETTSDDVDDDDDDKDGSFVEKVKNDKALLGGLIGGVVVLVVLTVGGVANRIWRRRRTPSVTTPPSLALGPSIKAYSTPMPAPPSAQV